MCPVFCVCRSRQPRLGAHMVSQCRAWPNHPSWTWIWTKVRPRQAHVHLVKLNLFIRFTSLITICTLICHSILSVQRSVMWWNTLISIVYPKVMMFGPYASLKVRSQAVLTGPRRLVIVQYIVPCLWNAYRQRGSCIVAAISSFPGQYFLRILPIWWRRVECSQGVVIRTHSSLCPLQE